MSTTIDSMHEVARAHPGEPGTAEPVLGEVGGRVAELARQVEAREELRARAEGDLSMSVEEALLRELWRFEMYDASADVWSATLLDFLVDERRITGEEALGFAEASASPCTDLELDLVGRSLLTGAEVEAPRGSQRRRAIAGLFDDLDKDELWAGVLRGERWPEEIERMQREHERLVAAQARDRTNVGAEAPTEEEIS